MTTALEDTTQDDPILSALNTESRINHALLSIIEDATTVRLDHIHCTKTGKPIGRLDDSAIRDLLLIHGVSELTDCAQSLALATSIHPAWIKIDPSTLISLEAHCPTEFFCYAINLLVRNHHKYYTSESRTKIWLSQENQFLFNRSLVQAWYNCQALPLEDLRECNGILAKLIHLNIHNKLFFAIPWDTVGKPTSAIPQVTHEGKAAGQLRKLMAGSHMQAKEAFYFQQWQGNVRKVLPHDMATPEGIAWIKRYLNSLLASVLHAIATDDKYRSTVEMNSLFGRVSNIKTINEMLAYHTRDIDYRQLVIVPSTEIKEKIKAYSDKMAGVVAQATEAGTAIVTSFAAELPAAKPKVTLMQLLSRSAKG